MTNMTISPEIERRINEEEVTLAKTLESLNNSLNLENQKLYHHSREARNLTSEMVNTQRDSDKQLLANDETIAHQLSQRARDTSSSIEKLLESPYFGRIIIEEEINNRKKVSEYKIGKFTNLEAGILDWKTSPLARIFYEYEEGEEFLEDIRDRERSGILTTRTKIKIDKSNLVQISCNLGTFIKKENTWEVGGAARGSKTGQFTLPDILSLITAEQFRLITEDASQPVILHGVAGSGKTSVALHRLVWQLENVTDCSPLVLAPTQLLCRYVQNSLTALDVKTEIPIVTIKKWIDDLANSEDLWSNYKRIGILPPAHIARFKSSAAFLKTLIYVAKNNSGTYVELVQKALYEESYIIENDRTRTISKETIRETRSLFLKNQTTKSLDEIDTELILFLKMLKAKSQGKYLYTHVFLDEFQDVSAVELAIVGLTIKDLPNLTITGDSEQQTTESIVYTEAIEALFSTLGGENQQTAIYPLSISHRSTIQIMKFADALLGKSRTMEGREGRAPLVIQCQNHTHAFDELRAWIGRVSEKYAGETVLILTRNGEEAKQLTSLLYPYFQDGVSTLFDAPRNTEGMILIASIQDCKGLEFPHVCVWGINSDSFPTKNWARRRLYLAATRAEEHLAMIYWGIPTPLLPNANSKLYRLYDARPEIEDMSTDRRESS